MFVAFSEYMNFKQLIFNLPIIYNFGSRLVWIGPNGWEQVERDNKVKLASCDVERLGRKGWKEILA